jgi:hypothetical protein
MGGDSDPGFVWWVIIVLTDLDHDSIFSSIQFFIIYVLSQQPQGQLRTQHSVANVITYWTNTT